MKKSILTTGLISLGLLFFSSNIVDAADLKNANAFSYKLNSSIQFDNGATVTAHKNALEHAFVKLNGVRDVSLKRHSGGSAGKVWARSVNDSSNDSAGWWTGNANGGMLYMNRWSTERANFSTANYRKLALHELGHAMGMVHQYAPTDSLMKQGKMTYQDYTTLDKNNLNWRY